MGIISRWYDRHYFCQDSTFLVMVAGVGVALGGKCSPYPEVPDLRKGALKKKEKK